MKNSHLVLCQCWPLVIPGLEMFTENWPQEAEQEEVADAKPDRSRRRRKHHGEGKPEAVPAEPAVKEQKEVKEPKHQKEPVQPKPQAEEGEAARKPRRRPSHRRRRPKSGAEGTKE